MSKFGVGERAPWGDFPRVIRNDDLGALQDEPEYQAAKAGDKQAALDLVDRLLTDDTAQRIKDQTGDRKPLVLPVLAVEAAGNNKIPLAMAEVLADRLGLGIELGIVQREKVGRTGAGSDHRLAFNPSFKGDVKAGHDYLVVDDTLTMGGTIASLRGYVENHGGKVVAASVMTAHEGALDLAVKPKMLAGIAEKHGPVMNAFWQETFGYGIDKLTQGEAGHLRRAASVDEIRDRLAKARHEGIKRLDAAGATAPAQAMRGATQAVSEAGHLRRATSVDEIRDRLTKARHEGSERLGRQGIGSPLSSEKGESAKRTEVSSALEQSYQETLSSYILAKYEQADHVESRLEHLIDRRQAHLQQRQLSQPGFLSLPAARKAWQAQQARQQAGLNKLRARLKTVQKIKSGIRIEAFATSKMRRENPQLASDWDAMRQAKRQQQTRAKQQNHKPLERGRGRSLGPDR